MTVFIFSLLRMGCKKSAGTDEITDFAEGSIRLDSITLASTSRAASCLDRFASILLVVFRKSLLSQGRRFQATSFYIGRCGNLLKALFLVDREPLTTGVHYVEDASLRLQHAAASLVDDNAAVLACESLTLDDYKSAIFVVKPCSPSE